MAALDAVVMCSDHEGLPMTALEAAVVGVPMVAHAVGGLPDVVPHECLVFEHDANGYKTCLMRLLMQGTGEAWAQMQARVLEDYSCIRNAARTRSLYEQLRAARALSARGELPLGQHQLRA